MKRFLFFLALFALPFSAFARTDEYDVFLLIGQSNMAGRAPLTPEDELPLDGVWLLDDRGKPVPASEPLNQFSTIRKKLSKQRFNIGDSFSREIHTRTGRKVLLVVNARGGSALGKWLKNSEQGTFNKKDGDEPEWIGSPIPQMYAEAVRRTRQAMKYGTLKAVLWHQGEADSGGTRPEEYTELFGEMISDLRHDLGVDVPVIVGETCRANPRRDRINAVLRAMPSKLPGTYFVSSDHCSPIKDNTHFDRDALITLGHRYAGIVLEKVYGITPSIPFSGDWAVVNISDAFMRQSPDYESACVSQTRMGTIVKVTDSSRYWRKINTPEPYSGWTNALALSPCSAGQAFQWTDTPRYICTVEYTHVLSEPSDSAPRICDLVMSDILGKGEKYVAGWTSVILPDGRCGWVKEGEVTDFSRWASSATLTPEDLLSVARLFLGVPYMWGGMSPKHFDCSGFAGFCYFMCGVLLPRDASEQVKCGVEVAPSDMQAGDLVFFGEKGISHVALCAGPGRIIHSSQLVRENSLSKDDADYYGRNILHVRRIIGHVGDGSGAESISASPMYFKQ